MSIVKTEALLLKKIKFQDSSNIIRFYTKEQGKISVIAKGARQVKSQFRGYLEPLNHLSIIYYNKPTRDIQLLSKVDLIHTFINNPQDLTANSYGNGILETIDKLVHHNEETQKLFEMAINILKFIDQNPAQAKEAFLLFLLKSISFLGYGINFDNCAHCEKQLEYFYFDENNPLPVCLHCAGKYFQRISPQQLSWLKKTDSLAINPLFTQIALPPESDKIIDFLISYAGMHFDFYPKFNSLELLKYLK